MDNVRKDHNRRLHELERVQVQMLLSYVITYYCDEPPQSEDCSKAELIELNIELVSY